MPSRSDVNRHVRAQRQVSRLARIELERFWRDLPKSLDARATREALEEFLPLLVARYGDAAASVAAEWFERTYRASPVLASLPPDEQIRASTRWGVGPLFGGDGDQAAFDLLAGVVDQAVRQTAQDSLIESAASHGRGWARVPVGDTCAFCLMLASRGYVYGSAESAGQARKFHPYDDCQIVPEDGDPPEGYDPDELYGRYLDARREAGSGSPKKILSALREQEGIH